MYFQDNTNFAWVGIHFFTNYLQFIKLLYWIFFFFTSNKINLHLRPKSHHMYCTIHSTDRCNIFMPKKYYFKIDQYKSNYFAPKAKISPILDLFGNYWKWIGLTFGTKGNFNFEKCHAFWGPFSNRKCRLGFQDFL